MEKDNRKKLEEIFQSNWTNFQSTLREYMLQKESTKGMQQLWEHFQIYLCILEHRGDWNKFEEKQALLISEQVIQIKFEKGWDAKQVFKKAEEEAAKEEEVKRNNQVWSVCKVISEIMFFSEYKDVIREKVKSNIDGYQVEWIGLCQATASEQEKVTAAVVLEFLGKCFDNLNIIVKASEDHWQCKADEVKFNFIQVYKDAVFERYGFPGEIIIKDIAAARYETRENNAVAYFMERANIDKLLKDQESESTAAVSFIQSCYQKYKMGINKNISSTRKILETCRAGKRYLLVEQEPDYYLRGIVTESKIGKIADEEFSIHFMGNSEWKICKGQESFLVFRNNQYYTDDSRVDTALEKKIADMACIAEDKRDKFKNIFQRMQDQQHGALMIVTNNASGEADRLCSKYQRGMQIEALDLADEDALDLLSGLAAIDGAVMIDFEGKCHGFGVILDGEAQVEGNTGRGARFNSSTNYIAGKKSYSVIVSEDREKGIDILYGLDQKIIK